MRVSHPLVAALLISWSAFAVAAPSGTFPGPGGRPALSSPARGPLAAAPSVPDLRARFDLVDLGTLGGSFSSPAGINARGQVVGRSTRNDRPECQGADVRVPCEVAFLWSDGQMTDLGHLDAGGQRTVPTGLDDAGRFVGFEDILTTDDRGRPLLVTRPFVHRDGAFRALPLLVADVRAMGLANAISPTGVITGFSDDDHHAQTLVTWVDEAVLRGPVSAHTNRRGQGINTSGVIAGWQYAPRSFMPTNGFVAQDGVVTNLSADDVNLWSEALDVNDAGLVVGDKADRAFAAGLATTWQRRQGQLVARSYGALPGHNRSALVKVNGAGVAVGWSEDELAGGPSRAVMTWHGRLVDLTAALRLDRVVLLTATGINDAGDIVGEALRADGSVHAYLLRRR